MIVASPHTPPRPPSLSLSLSLSLSFSLSLPPKCIHSPLLLLGNFVCFFFIIINFSKKIFQEYHQSVKQFGSRSSPTFCRVQTVCKGYQQSTKVATSGERINARYSYKQMSNSNKACMFMNGTLLTVSFLYFTACSNINNSRTC